MEMNLNVYVAIACVIGMIGFLSWGLVKNFEDKLRSNSGMHTEKVFPTDAPVEEKLDDSMDDAPVDDAPVDDAPVDDAPVDDAPVDDAPVDDAPVDDAPLDDELDSDEVSAWRQVGEATGWDMVIDTTVANEVKNSPKPEEDGLKQIRMDIDSFHEHIEELGHKVEVTHNLVTQMSESVIGMNDATINNLSEKISTIQTSLAKEFKILTDTQTSLSDSLLESKLTIGSLLAKPTPDYVTHATLMTYATLDSMNFMKKMMLDEFRMNLADYVPLRDLVTLKAQIPDFVTLKTQLDEMSRRSQVQKTVYQAWNGSADWNDFNEGKLNIQMIRKKFMTAEQNEEWLLPENKKIAAYNRDQLLGLDDLSWETKDNSVFVKRYYKDDWDASIEVAITVTLSKKILVPPGGKPEVTMSHILRKLSETEKIQWEHLLVNV